MIHMKRVLLATILLMGAQAQGDAQLLNKIGKALNKVNEVAKAISGKSQPTTTGNADEERVVGRPVVVGTTTVSTHGNNQGLTINWFGAERIYGSSVVTVGYQLVNTSGLQMNVRMGEATHTGSYLLDGTGRKYAGPMVNLGSFTMRYDNNCRIASGAKVRCGMSFEDVPSNVTSLQMAMLGFDLSLGNDTRGYQGSFRAKNIPVRLLPVITSKGIYGDNQLRLGDRIGSLPKSFSGLYDAFTVADEDFEGDVYKLITFTKNGKETLTAISYDRQAIGQISVKTPGVYCLINNRYYACGQSIANQKISMGLQEDDYGRMLYNGIAIEEDNNQQIFTFSIGESPM